MRSLLAAQYRTGQFHNALKTLHEVRQDCRCPRPELESFGVMALRAVNDPAAAQAATELQKLAEQDDFRHDAVAQQLVREALGD